MSPGVILLLAAWALLIAPKEKRTSGILIVLVSAIGIVASMVYSYTGGTVFYIGPRIAMTPAYALTRLIFVTDVVVVCIRLMRKKRGLAETK